MKKIILLNVALSVFCSNSQMRIIRFNRLKQSGKLSEPYNLFIHIFECLPSKKTKKIELQQISPVTAECDQNKHSD